MQYKVLIAALLAAAGVRADELAPLPSIWNGMPFGGPNQLPGECEAGVDRVLADAGQPNMTIRCANDTPSFAGRQQEFDAEPYRGKRIRYSGWLMARGVENVGDIEGAGGLWIMVGSPSGFLMNRMPDRAVSGYTSWEYRDFVVDVPEGANGIAIGYWMEGKGQIWIRDIAFDVVSTSVAANLTWDDRPAPGPNLSLE